VLVLQEKEGAPSREEQGAPSGRFPAESDSSDSGGSRLPRALYSGLGKGASLWFLFRV